MLLAVQCIITVVALAVSAVYCADGICVDVVFQEDG